MTVLISLMFAAIFGGVITVIVKLDDILKVIDGSPCMCDPCVRVRELIHPYDMDKDTCQNILCDIWTDVKDDDTKGKHS